MHMKKRYGKLVRDNIPKIIRANGEFPHVRVMETDEYRRELLYKLIEEAEEVRQAGYDASDPEFTAEIADVLEVIDAILVEFNIDNDRLEMARTERRNERGGLNERIFLEAVT